MINCVIFALLFIKIHFYFYVSINVNSIDDCITKIILMNKGYNYTFFEIDNKYMPNCEYNHFEYYPNDGKPIIKNKAYNLGDKIYLEIYNQGYKDGYIDITFYVNEFIIQSSSLQQFLKCTNCFGNNNNYIFSDNTFYLFEYFSSNYRNNDYNKYYDFYFMIENFSYFNNYPINDEFYSLTNKKIFNHSIYYKNNELELINFNTTENFYITDNDTINFTYTNYYFNIIFKNNFYGNLVGLDSNNSEINLTNGSNFYINETKGLKNILSPNEKYNYYAYLFLKIRACNKYLSKYVSQEEEFQFYITLIGDNLKCLNDKNNIYLGSIYLYNCTDLLEKDLNDSIKIEIIQRTEIDKKSKIIGNNIIINISPINSTFFNNSISKNLIECDKILKKKIIFLMKK